MTTRPAKGRGLFYHRDSAGNSELAPAAYVEWAATEARKLGVRFAGTGSQIDRMIQQKISYEDDLHIDYGISGNILDRPGFNRFRRTAIDDLAVSHLFVSHRDRIARPDNPFEATTIELELRAAGLTIVFQGKVLPPILPGQRLELGDALDTVVAYDNSGRFRRDLAQKLIHAKLGLIQLGCSIGGTPMYGFRRWLCTSDGQQVRELTRNERVKLPGHHVF